MSWHWSFNPKESSFWTGPKTMLYKTACYRVIDILPTFWWCTSEPISRTKYPFQVGLNRNGRRGANCLHASQSIDTISLCKTCSTRCGPFSSNAHIHSYYHIHTSYSFLFQSYTYQTPFHPHTLTKPESLRKAHSFPVSFSHTSSSSHTVPFLFYLL